MRWIARLLTLTIIVGHAGAAFGGATLTSFSASPDPSSEATSDYAVHNTWNISLSGNTETVDFKVTVAADVGSGGNRDVQRHFNLVVTAKVKSDVGYYVSAIWRLLGDLYVGEDATFCDGFAGYSLLPDSAWYTPNGTQDKTYIFDRSGPFGNLDKPGTQRFDTPPAVGSFPYRPLGSRDAPGAPVGEDTYFLTFKLDAHAHSYSCEAAVRIGASLGSAFSSCPACAGSPDNGLRVSFTLNELPTPTPTPTHTATPTPIATSTRTTTPTRTAAPTPTPTDLAVTYPVTAQSCPGDLDGNSKVTVDELVTSVNSALTGCPTPLTNLPIVGSWFGSFATHGLAGGGGTQTLTVRSDGTADLNADGQPFHLQLTVLNAQRRMYGLRRTEDDLTGALQVSADGRYAVYIDEYGAFGVLQRGPSALASSYSAADLPEDWFSGTAVTYGPASGLGGGHAALTISDVSSFIGTTFDQPPHFVLLSHRLNAGTGAAQPVTISADAGFAALGVFTGGWSGNAAAGNQLSGNATFIMSPDKNFLATEICFGDFPADCQYSDWERQTGPYRTTCGSCQGNVNDADQGVLTCDCPNDQADFGQTSLPLPCVGGSLVNQNGALTCELPRFVDNGDGTVTDNQTGLMWEQKKDQSYYSWSHTGTAPDGTVFTDFLNMLNGGATGVGNCTDATTQSGGFAGHCDWRLPTIVELNSIVDTTQGACAGMPGPCLDPIFGLFSAYVWSSTSAAADQRYAKVADITNGATPSFDKTNPACKVIAVRGGL